MKELACDCGGVLHPALLQNVDLKLYFGLHAVVREVPGEQCDRCGWSTLTGPVITALRHQLVGVVLELPDRLPPKFLYFLRVYLGLTQQELAKRMGITRKTVSQWEAKAGISPQHDYILRTLAYAKLAEALQPPRPTVLDHVRTTAAKRAAPLVVPGLRAA